ncbi:MAG TPA: hypothetical protein VF170_17820 [Planctomycetaceae bacterium]
MSGRFAGSKSLDERRRRRIAADEPRLTPSPSDAAAAPKPLPIRRPTGRFPLRRIVSRSPWKLAGVGLAALALCGAGLAAGHLPPVRSGAYGPGLAALCSAESGRLTTALGGLLLLATGQLAWLIRWARARSLRDFRGGYRIWWWTSLAFVGGGVALLTDADLAFASTLAWLTEARPLGSDAAFRLLPAAAALVLLLPSLQGDMRGCRTSRGFVFAAAALWLAGGVTLLASGFVGQNLARVGLTVPPAAVTTGLFLTGAVAAFTGLLVHARHVVYESVEPPDPPVRKKAAVAAEEPAVEAGEEKPKRTSTRRSGRAKAEEPAAAKAPEPKPAKSEPKVKEQSPPAEDAAPEPVAKPHFVKSQPAKPQPAPPPVAAKPQPKPEPAKPEPVATTPVPESDDEWSEEDAVSADGRRFRLDGPEDALKGLSKRERRKLRKAAKDRERAEM